MITNIGKNILAKYLIGQAPAYASHIAIGCGTKPLASDATLGDYSGKQSLDFEMFRVPITSRGYVTEEGQSKIVFTAELPTAERYEITEVGIWSAGANPSAGAYDSKTIYSFSETETWEHHTQTNSLSIPSIQISLGENNVITGSYKLDSSRKYSSTGTLTELPVFQTNADNPTFTNSERVNRYERCRFLNNIMVIRGDMSNLSLTGGVIGIPTGSNHIHLNGANLDFDKNAPTDQLKLAFSVINKDGESSIQPDEVRIVIEFSDTDEANATNAQYARFPIVIKETDAGVDFATNRYFVSTVALQGLLKTSGFSWNVVNTVKIYAAVIKNGAVSNNYYVCLDALRLENITSSNPVYGLSGYSVIKNTGAQPILKFPNTTNHIEFRFGMDVL
jgi:hypothetical protein